MLDNRVKAILQLAIENKASDVHFFSDAVPKIKINGKLTDITNFSDLNVDEKSTMIMSLLDQSQRDKLINEREVDFSLAIESARFRVNVYFQKGTPAAALRTIPSEIPLLSSLNLPSSLPTFLNAKQGFVLVTGPTGQGKSTTVASMINEINLSRESHIVTIEDPIEYIMQPKRAMISQRELGFDTDSFAKALRSCLRQDPDVVFVGEMRDLETIQSALTVAETGHLVFSTLHTNSAAQTVDRIIDVFPEGSQGQIRMQLASVITAIISQRLVPTVDGGRIPAVELLIANGAVKNLIREGKTHMIDNIIQTSSDAGMLTLEMSLASWIKKGKIDELEALNYCLRPAELQSQLRSARNY